MKKWIRLITVFVLCTLSVLSFASTQDYVFVVRNNGIPVTGLAGTMTVAYFNASTTTSVGSPTVTIQEYGTTGSYVIHYDPSSVPLVAVIDAGNSLTGNDRYITLHLPADPSNQVTIMGLVSGTSITNDVMSAFNTALSGTPTGNSLYDMMQRSLKDLPSTQNSNGLTGAAKVVTTRYYPHGTSIVNRLTTNQGIVAPIITATVTYLATGEAATISYQ